MLYNLMSPYLDSSVFFLRHITHIRHNCPCSIDQWEIYCTITSAVVINARRLQFLLVQVPLTWISLDIDDVANVNGELRSDDDDVTPLVSNEYSCIWDWDFTLATHNVCEPIEFLSSKRGLNLWDSIKLDYSCLCKTWSGSPTKVIVLCFCSVCALSRLLNTLYFLYNEAVIQ